jgi:CBS domain-containing protein
MMAINERNMQEISPSTSFMSGGGKTPTVRDLMTRDPQCVTPEETLQRVARLMAECDCGAIPVVDSLNRRKVLGIVTDRDIVIRVVARGKDASSAKVSEAMSDGLYSVRESDSMDKVQQMMRQHQIRRVPVVDDKECLIGIVALADVATEGRSNRGDHESKLADTVEEISSSGKMEASRR